MVEINLELCKSAAIAYGLPLQFVVKEFYLFDVLSQITAFAAGSKKLVFKGGTALSKVYLGRMQRFSEDLDFDFNGESAGELRSFCEALADKLRGYEVGEFRKIKDVLYFPCRYQSPLGTDHIRIDIGAKKIFAHKPILIAPAISTYATLTVTGFHVYSLEDIVARKLHALRTRAEGKDLYDVYHALHLCGELGGAIGKMLKSEKSGEEPKEFISKTIQMVKKVDYRKLRNLTNPFIPANNRPRDWLELKNDLMIKLERLL